MYEQTEVFEAAEMFARAEGILPAPESSHAIKAAIDTALECKDSGEAKTILFGLSGTGYFDLVAYQQFNDGTMTDYIPTDEDLIFHIMRDCDAGLLCCFERAACSAPCDGDLINKSLERL